MRTKSDQELLKSYIDGNQVALGILFKRYESRIHSYICRKVNDKSIADDILQDVLIKIISTFNNGKYNEEGKFLPWALRVSHNMIVDHYRSSKKMKVINESDSFSENYSIFDFIKSEDSIEDAMINDQNNKDLWILIKQLPEDQQEVLELRFYNDLSFKEIAIHTNVGINTALGRLRYAIINLRKLMEKQNVAFA